MFRELLCAGTLVCALSSPGAESAVLSVVDEDGVPVPQFEVMIHTADHGYSNWTEGRNGRITLPGSFDDALVIEAFVRGKDYASAVVPFSGDEKRKLLAGNATITLKRGRDVDLQFRLPEGFALPEGFTPEMYFARFAERVRMMRQPANRGLSHFDFNVGDAVSRGANRFSVRLPQNPPPFYVAIHRPGFLQFFEAGPFTASDVRNGRLEIDVPQPAGIDVSFDCGEVPTGELPYQSVAISVLWRIPDTNNRYYTVAEDRRDDVRHSLKLDDLAPATYIVRVRTTPKPDVQPDATSRLNPGAFFENREISVRSGETKQLRVPFIPFDPDAFRGGRSARVRILDRDGRPAAGEKATVGYFDGHYGRLPVFDGVVPESGVIELDGITDRRSAKEWPFGSYFVKVNDRHVGDFDLPEEGVPRLEFRIPLGAGDTVPDVQVLEIATGETVRLKGLRGKIVSWSSGRRGAARADRRSNG